MTQWSFLCNNSDHKKEMLAYAQQNGHWIFDNQQQSDDEALFLEPTYRPGGIMCLYNQDFEKRISEAEFKDYCNSVPAQN